MALLVAEMCGLRTLPLPRAANLPEAAARMSEPIGLFGGTFDPIHYGHLRTAFELWQSLRLAQVRFLPTANPPHREPTLARPNCACKWCAPRSPDRAVSWSTSAKMRRPGVSYSVDTLPRPAGRVPRSFPVPAARHGRLPGAAQLGPLATDLRAAHLVVAHRPGWKAPITGPLGEVMVDRGTGSVRDLHQSRAGRVYVQAVTQLEISSTDLRQLIYSGRDLRYLVPEAVRELIVRHPVLCSTPAMSAEVNPQA